ncbi:MAG: hypothetical protein JO166_08920 [Deltaproteobacteria bacterium]|nr:hypothetical protein [Deltaproteobacteria bacterium]
MPEPARHAWRDDATDWIEEHAAKLPQTPDTRWNVERPSPQALESALFVIRRTPDRFVPVALTVTLNRGIEVDWRHGSKELEIEILSDGSLEILRFKDGETCLESKLPKPDASFLHEAFEWLAS